MHVSRRPLFSLIVSTLSYTAASIPIANPLPVVQDTETDIPAPKSPKSSKESITIYTDADVTWCRPWPNTAIHHQNSAHFYRGTPLNLTCWVPNDIPETEEGPGLSEPIDIWVKTGEMGCYINENDLRSANINFEEALHLCLPAGPHPLSGNRPENMTGTAIPVPVPSPVAPSPAALPNPAPIILPSPSIPKPVDDNAPPLHPNPSAVSPKPTSVILPSPSVPRPVNDNALPPHPNPSAVSPNPAPAIPSPNTPKPINDNIAPVHPNPSAVSPNPAPAIPSPNTPKPANENAAPLHPNPSLVPSASPELRPAETMLATPLIPFSATMPSVSPVVIYKRQSGR